MKSVKINLNNIIPNAEQPRQFFDEVSLAELSQSIKTDGLMTPILLRPVGDKYEIVQGERRYRASKLAGLTEIDAFINELSDDDAFHLSVIENIQREQLTPIEEARAFKKYVDLGYTHDKIAEKVSKSRTYVTSRLRLLKLIPEIQDMIAEGKISEGHAKQVMVLEGIAKRLCGSKFMRYYGDQSAYEELQYRFYHAFKKVRPSVKDVSNYVENWKHYFITAIVGRLNGHGDLVIDETRKVRIRGLCIEWDLQPSSIRREDIHYLRDKFLEINNGEYKASTIYKIHEDLEEYWFDSGRELKWSEVEEEIQNKKVFELDLNRLYVFD